MACNYNIIINGVDGYGSEKSPIKLETSSDQMPTYSVELLIKDLGKLNRKQLDLLLQQITVADLARKAASEVAINPVNKRSAIHALTVHLNLLGVNIVELDRANPDYKYKNTDAYTENGIIYICSDADITAPMHEMMHLVFGVMKAKDFLAYSRLMKLISLTEPFLILYKSISLQPEYAHMMDLDRQEETIIRLFEGLYTNNIQIDDLIINDANIYDYMNRALIPYILLTFGVEKVTSILLFLKDSISDLPTEGSTLFMRPKIATVGYSNYKDEIAIYGKITNLILMLSTPDENGNSIIQENCK